MLNIGDKLYYIDYEESKASYTIESIYDARENENFVDDYYYVVHSDSLPKGVGYYPISINCVDSNNIKDRFFSNPELAHTAYVNFLNYRKEKLNES